MAALGHVATLLATWGALHRPRHVDEAAMTVARRIRRRIKSND